MITVLSRTSVQRTAEVIGPQSAAAQALRCVESEHDGLAEVCRPDNAPHTLVVVPHADLRAAGWSPDA